MDDESNTDADPIYTSMPFECQELILYGSLKAAQAENLERRLIGLCDPGSREFQEHELVFNLRTSSQNSSYTSDVVVRLRRIFNFEAFSPNVNKWHMRYIGVAEPVQKCPVIVRKTIDSTLFSGNMMEFVKSLGLRMEYEYITKGRVYTKGPIKIVLNELKKSDNPGKYDAAHVKSFSDSILIEMSTTLPLASDYTDAAKQLRDFADQLLPLVKMEKVDYWRK